MRLDTDDTDEPLTEPEDADDPSNVEVIESGDSGIILAHPPQTEVRSKNESNQRSLIFSRKNKQTNKLDLQKRFLNHLCYFED